MIRVFTKGQRVRTFHLGEGTVESFEHFPMRVRGGIEYVSTDPQDGCRVVLKLDNPSLWPVEGNPAVARHDIRE